MPCWVDYKNLTYFQLFNMCVKGEHGGAAKTLLHSKLIYSVIREAVIGEELECERELYNI